jgi:hypothetical protein
MLLGISADMPLQHISLKLMAFQADAPAQAGTIKVRALRCISGEQLRDYLT